MFTRYVLYRAAPVDHKTATTLRDCAPPGVSGRGAAGSDPHEAHERDGGGRDVEHDGEHGEHDGAPFRAGQR